MSDRLSYYLDTWALGDPQPLAETFTSQVYTVQYQGETAVLKLLKPGETEEQTGALALDYFGGLGAVRLLRLDEGVHLLEYAGDEDLVPMAQRGEDTQAAAIIAEVLNQLHAPRSRAVPEGLHPLRHWLRALFAKAAKEEALGDKSIYRRAAALAEVLLATEHDCRVLHGDIHHANIRHHPQRGWLAFDPKGLYGERTYDTANTLYNALYLPDAIDDEARLLKVAGVVAEKTGIDLQRLLQFAFVYGCLSAAWSLEANEEHYAIQALHIAGLVEKQL